ncbi:U1 small nuclear ribonucleoprotein C-like [Triticum dicoccoides]|uniref:U1 small nuclear ribonucleoprotein C-like n=1 Tax=Triticum dicoccoides TaxID=85692 RepID=UPI00189175B1|nr:U1 small nuclear ribonucleoprotein C-like [Triticum dicoccoides]
MIQPTPQLQAPKLPRYKTCVAHTSPAHHLAGNNSTHGAREQSRAMEQSKPSVFLGLLVLLACAGWGHGMRLLHDDSVGDEEYAREFAFGSMEAAATETAPQDASLDDYEDEISRVEFEPGRGASYDATVAPGPAPGPATAGSDAAAARTGTGSMKWWLPPSTMPSFPLFPNPGGMPGMPIPAMPVPLPALPGMPAMPMPGGMPMPMPAGIPGGGMPMPMPGGIPGGGMPFNFKPEGWGAGAAPSPPSRAQPTPPAAGASDGAADSSSDNPNPNEAIH